MNIFTKSLIITAFIVAPLAIIDFANLDMKLQLFWQEWKLLAIVIFFLPATIQLFRWIVILTGKENKNYHPKRSLGFSAFPIRTKK